MLHFCRFPDRIFRAKIACFALLAVLQLAMGMAATGETFNVASAASPQWLQSQHTRQLFDLRVPTGAPYGASSTGGDTTSFSLPVFERLRRDHRAFAEVMAYAPLGSDKIAVHAGDISEEARGEMVSGNFLSGLGVKMELGDRFKMEDERRHTPFIVLSLDYWTHLYIRNPGVLGETMYINGVPFAILGVTAEGFSGVEPGKPTDFWIPLQNRPELTPRGISAKEQTLYGSPNWWCLGLIARLAPGMDAQRAVAEATPGFRAAAYASLGAPSPESPALSLVPAKEIGGLNDDSGNRTPVLKALAALLLLMACGYAAMRIRMWRTART
ncbi:MAG TPA: ABC transporter permease [Acidobacteriaceae bacterium]|nr:ABC transporter permease [Acidobacteriaceae bacterium]